jgi:hypothetical protein
MKAELLAAILPGSRLAIPAAECLGAARDSGNFRDPGWSAQNRKNAWTNHLFKKF